MIKSDKGTVQIEGNTQMIMSELEMIFRALRECADFKDSDFKEMLDNSKKSMDEIKNEVAEKIKEKDLDSIITDIIKDIKNAKRNGEF